MPFYWSKSCQLLVYQHFYPFLAPTWGFKTQNSPEESVREQLCLSAGRTNLPFMKSPREREWWSSQAWWRTNLFHKWHEIQMLPLQRWNPSPQEEFPEKRSFLQWWLDKVGQKTSKKSLEATVQRSQLHLQMLSFLFLQNWNSVPQTCAKEQGEKPEQNTLVIYRR